MCFRNAVWMCRALWFLKILIASTSLSRDNNCKRELGNGRVLISSLITALTYQVKAFASRVWSFHLPLFTITESMELAETGQDLAGLLLLVRLLSVFQAFQLEWVKSSSHLC